MNECPVCLIDLEMSHQGLEYVKSDILHIMEVMEDLIGQDSQDDIMEMVRTNLRRDHSRRDKHRLFHKECFIVIQNEFKQMLDKSESQSEASGN